MCYRNQKQEKAIVKSVQGHSRLQNERDILRRFQSRAPTLRPLTDEIIEPSEPPAIVLKYLDTDLLRESALQRLTRPEIKTVSKSILEALKVLHEDGFVHTGI
jgi:serine/threonine protein kinase